MGSPARRRPPYPEDDGIGTLLKHARVSLGGQDLILMDSHVSHGITFNEAISLQIICRDQGEVDHFWDGLRRGGRESHCGWLQDPFGVSWQLVPEGWVDIAQSDDTAAVARATRALLQKRKLDLALLRAAFEG